MATILMTVVVFSLISCWQNNPEKLVLQEWQRGLYDTQDGSTSYRAPLLSTWIEAGLQQQYPEIYKVALASNSQLRSGIDQTCIINPDRCPPPPSGTDGTHRPKYVMHDLTTVFQQVEIMGGGQMLQPVNAFVLEVPATGAYDIKATYQNQILVFPME